MLRPSLMAGAILFPTATRGGDKGAFDPGIEGGDLVNKLASFGFEGTICCFHIRIVLLHYGHVKQKKRTSLQVLVGTVPKSSTQSHILIDTL